MEQKYVLAIAAVMLIVGVAIGYTIPDPGTASNPVGKHMMGDGGMMGQNIDQHFIVQMIPHHEGAIEMAHVALERSKRPEIVSLANAIIEAQEAEIGDMRSWHQSWFGSAPSEGGMGHNMPMHGMSGDTNELRSVSDEEFDRAFIEQMIPHHEMAIMMADMLAAATTRPEMAALARQITTSQSREIEMMRGWLAAWYGSGADASAR